MDKDAEKANEDEVKSKKGEAKPKSGKKFKFLDIAPSDAAFVAYGKDLAEVFANAAIALVDIIVDVSKVQPLESKHIEAEGYDLKSVMFDWLNEVLFIIATENFVFSRFDVQIDEVEGKAGGKKDKLFSLNAECWGEKLDFQRHEFKIEAKAVTYHMMDVKKEGNRWKAQVVVDL